MKKYFFVNVFSNYDVHYVCNSTVLDEDYDFVNEHFEEFYTWSGYCLINQVASLISDKSCISFYFCDDTLFVEFSNPDNGTGAYYVITIKEVKKNN